MTENKAQVNEIIGWDLDHTYIRRDGVLYDEWGVHYYHRQRIEESDIPSCAHRCNPPIRYTS